MDELITWSNGVFETFCEQNPSVSVRHATGSNEYVIRKDGIDQVRLTMCGGNAENGWAIAYTTARPFIKGELT